MIRIKIHNYCDVNVYVNGMCYKSKYGLLDIDVKPGVYRICVLNYVVIVLYKTGLVIIPFVIDFNTDFRVIRLFDNNYQGLLIEKGEIDLNGL